MYFIISILAFRHGGVSALEAVVTSAAKSVKQSFDPQVFLAKVGAGKTIIKYRKNDIIFAQGDAANTVFYIQNGKVKLTVVSEQGKEAIVGILGPGQFFGEGCLNGHPLRIATTTAMEDCVITSITKKAMIATLHNELLALAVMIPVLITAGALLLKKQAR